MPLNPSLFPEEYSNLCPGTLVSETDRFGELERRLLILRYQMLSGQKKDGQSIAELQNATLPVSNSLFPTLELSVSYLGGGVSRSGLSGQIDKFVHRSETLSSLAISLSVPRIRHAGVASSARGYWAGGENPLQARRSDVEAIVFGTETKAVVSAALSTATAYFRGVQTGSKGYFAGNFRHLYAPNYSPTNGTGKIDALTFSSEAIAALSATLPSVLGGNMAVQSTTKGYFAGGYNDPSNRRNVNTLTFSNESTTVLSAQLANTGLARIQGAGVASQTKGYFVSGNTYRGVDGITFATETIAIISSALASNGDWDMDGASSTRRGFTWGGTINYDQHFEALNFATEIMAPIGTILSRPGGYLIPVTRN